MKEIEVYCGIGVGVICGLLEDFGLDPTDLPNDIEELECILEQISFQEEYS